MDSFLEFRISSSRKMLAYRSPASNRCVVWFSQTVRMISPGHSNILSGHLGLRSRDQQPLVQMPQPTLGSTQTPGQQQIASVPPQHDSGNITNEQRESSANAASVPGATQLSFQKSRVLCLRFVSCLRSLEASQYRIISSKLARSFLH